MPEGQEGGEGGRRTVLEFSSSYYFVLSFIQAVLSCLVPTRTFMYCCTLRCDSYAVFMALKGQNDFADAAMGFLTPQMTYAAVRNVRTVFPYVRRRAGKLLRFCSRRDARAVRRHDVYMLQCRCRLYRLLNTCMLQSTSTLLKVIQLSQFRATWPFLRQ
jgi:hypothetical protein